MKRLLILLVLLAVLAVGCGSSATETPLPPMEGPSLPTSVGAPAPPAALTPFEVQTRIRQNDVTLLDVRELYEWANLGHVDGAVLIPLGELAGRIDELDSTQEIIVVCNGGDRSRQGLQILQAAGFTNLNELGGGISAWAAAGLPLVNGE